VCTRSADDFALVEQSLHSKKTLLYDFRLVVQAMHSKKKFKKDYWRRCMISVFTLRSAALLPPIFKIITG